MNSKHEDMINKAIRKVPKRLREDAFQAGCVGLVIGLRNLNKTQNQDGYLYSCIRNEVTKEMGQLHNLYCLNTKTLLNLMKYKKAKAYGSDSGFKLATIEQLESIINKGKNV